MWSYIAGAKSKWNIITHDFLSDVIMCEKAKLSQLDFDLSATFIMKYGNKSFSLC